MNRLAVTVIGAHLLIATANADTLWTYTSSPSGASSSFWDRTATFVLSDGNRNLPPFLFEESLVTLDLVGQQLQYVADPQTGADFDYFAQLMTNGIDDRLNFEIVWNGASTSSVSSTFESTWFATSPFSQGVDLAGSEISAIVLRIFDISDGAPTLTNGLQLSYEITIEGTPPPDSDGDGDGDGIFDAVDNCQLLANPSQADADGDGIGTRCDGDFNNDCAVNPIDLGLMKANFFGVDPIYDLNESGNVDFSDLGLLASLFFMPPGPSGLPNACAP